MPTTKIKNTDELREAIGWLADRWPALILT